MSDKNPTILIIDDDRAICASLRLLFRRRKYNTEEIYHPRELTPNLVQRCDLVLLDMNFTVSTTGRAGLELLRQIRSLRSDVPVLLITAWATVQLAVEGMKLGANDFLAKPWDNKALLASVKDQLTLQQGASQEPTLMHGAPLGESSSFRAVLTAAQRVAPTTASVLITGESGTGKELLAESIHNSSDRAAEPFVRVNLGGIPSSLFESELFGHKAGAFTDARQDRIGRFALAEGGTIFLDEIGELELASQVKLLRVLQEHTYEILGESQSRRTDVRVICATNRDLKTEIENGNFREDLYYRINLIELHLPPLRERTGDAALLAEHFLQLAAGKYDRPRMELTAASKNWINEFDWPGNIRQLQHVIERCTLLGEGQLTVSMLRRQVGDLPQESSSNLALEGLSLDDLERIAVERALARCKGQISLAARELGITRSSLYRRMEKHDLRP